MQFWVTYSLTWWCHDQGPTNIGAMVRGGSPVDHNPLPLSANSTLCTEDWFAKTETYVLAVQPIGPVWQNRCDF